MKKVGLFISGMNKGGAERVVSRLTNILEDDFEVYLILCEDTYMEYKCRGTLINMDVKATNTKWDKPILLYKRIKKLKKIKIEYDLDIVISFLDSPNIVNVLSKTGKCKTVVSIRNFSENENKNSILGKLTNIAISGLYNKADKIIPVTKLIAQNYEENYGIQKEKMSVIYNPYDIVEIQNLANECIQDEYSDFFEQGRIFISVGRQMYQKGFWHLIKSFKLVHDKYSDAKLVIIGRDCDDIKIRTLINQLELNESVLLTGQQENPFKFIKKSYIYVMSSLFEGFPNSMVEAMACGCPIISTDCKSGPREILYENPDLSKTCKDIEKADYGILVPPFDTSEDWNFNNISYEEKLLAQAMILMLSDENIQKKYSKKSIYRSKAFNYNICKQKFTKIIN